MVATITARWIRAVALTVGRDPKKTTVEMARDIAFINRDIKNLSEFLEDA